MPSNLRSHPTRAARVSRARRTSLADLLTGARRLAKAGELRSREGTSVIRQLGRYAEEFAEPARAYAETLRAGQQAVILAAIDTALTQAEESLTPGAQSLALRVALLAGAVNLLDQSARTALRKGFGSDPADVS